MKKVNELTSEELFHLASLVNNNYIYNYNTFEYVIDDGRIMIGANNCVWLQLKHAEGKLTTVSHKTNMGWVDIPSVHYNEVMSYLKDLDYIAQGYEPSTKITIDESIMLLDYALEDVVKMDELHKTEFLLDVVNSYKKQLNLTYGETK